MSPDNQITITSEQLAQSGITDQKQATANLERIASRIGVKECNALLPALLGAISRTAEPDGALNNFERFVEALAEPARLVTVVGSRPDVAVSLVTIFGGSRFLSLYLISLADAALEPFSRRSYLDGPMSKGDLETGLAAMIAEARTEAEFLKALRMFRKREMLRIGLRDLLDKADLAETVLELSNLAEVCLQAAYEQADAALREKFGRPLASPEDGPAAPAGFAVIAMGKLGGRELNFSSDIDLMYVYSVDGETEGAPTAQGASPQRITNHEYFVKLAERITTALARNTEDGFVFRVDLRLRPEGQRGPLAQSLGGYEIYYESWGQAWERSALIKARPVAGDEAVGREFVDRITPFVYRKYLDFGAIAEIRDMKQRINREVRQKGRTHRDVKLGYGGIREIEFLIQALQLIYGGRDRALRERGSLRALHLLAQKGLLSYQESAELTKAYIFLRTVEHRIQIQNDLQTQTMPSGGGDLRALARRKGYREPGRETDALLRDYAAHTLNVRTIYDNLLTQAPEAQAAEGPKHRFSLLLDPETGEQDAIMVLAQYGFHKAPAAYRNIMLLREGQAFVHQTPRSRRVFQALFPVLLHEMVESPNPDQALHHFESYLAAQGSWDAFQALVQQNTAAVRMLVAVFANSAYFSRMLIRSPELLEELLDGKEDGFGSRPAFRKGIAASLGEAGALAEKMDALRRFKHREEIRIGMADLLADLPAPAVWRGLSRLADVCLETVLRLASEETARRFGMRRFPAGLAIIGVGKLGGRELTYGSDLDILFVHAAEPEGIPEGTSATEVFSKTAEKVISYLTTMTREGAAYRIDTRLRPTGSKGPLVQSIVAFKQYYTAQAETWERQALVNSRFIAGDGALGREFREMLRDLIYRESDSAQLAADIRAMRMRIESELGKEDDRHYNIKQGLGGLKDIEFLAQYLQLMHGQGHPRVTTPGTFNGLRALRGLGALAPEDFVFLRDAYFFLRKIESRLRIGAGQGTSLLPRDEEKIMPLAKRMGYTDEVRPAAQQLLDEYERIRAEVRRTFERLVKA